MTEGPKSTGVCRTCFLLFGSSQDMPVPILYHIFKRPLPYLPTLALQEFIHAFQLRLSHRLDTSPADVNKPPNAANYPDVLLLLEHRPVYTAGRRQNEDVLRDEKTRLEKYGADWVATQRGGETTYHGPGQIVGYPLFDLERMDVRTLICFLKLNSYSRPLTDTTS